MASNERRLLWIDDDGADRYLYEKYVLEEVGWEISWARSVSEAVEELSAEPPFDAILLDQTLPFSDEIDDDGDIWAGCRILYWLRQKGGFPVNAPRAPRYDELKSPLVGNVEVPVCLVSAFFEKNTEAAMVQASEMDKNLVVVRKPIDVSELTSFLENTSIAE